MNQDTKKKDITTTSEICTWIVYDANIIDLSVDYCNHVETIRKEVSEVKARCDVFKTTQINANDDQSKQPGRCAV